MGIARTALLKASESAWLRNQVPRLGVARRMVRRFMPGETAAAALDATRQLNGRGVGVVLTCLGENVTTAAEADGVAAHYGELLTEAAAVDLELSIKPTHMGLDFDETGCARRIGRLAELCDASGRTLWIDMESSAYTDRTLALYRTLRPLHERLGICLQANLRRTREDAQALLPLRPAIRLVKGAYAESRARAYTSRNEVDAAFELLAAWLHREAETGQLRLVLGTHDLRSAARVRAAAPARPLELHMLYGIRTREQERLARDPGVRLRVLISYGAAWYPWFVRRLAERPANLLLALRG
jgi:proline dehydrogenase